MINFDPSDPEQYKKLQKAVKHSYRQLKPFRTVRKIVVEATRGHYFNNDSDTPDADRNPVNMLDQYIQALVRSFVQGQPRVRVTSREDHRLAKKFEAALNETAVEIDLQRTLRRCTQEALASGLGTAYCGIAATERDPVGESFVDPISLPNLVMDIEHEEFDQRDLVGHMFSRRLDEMKETGLYNPEQLANLSGRDRAASDMRDHDDGKSKKDDDSSLFEWVDIWAIKVIPANMIVYFSESQSVTAPLRVESYYGPDYGPYVHLALDLVPDEMMPNSRGAMLLDVHEFVNGQYRRVFMQEDTAATFWTYEGGSEEDARRVRDAQDGEMVMVNNNAGVTKRVKGGTNPQALGTAIHGRQLFDDMAGGVRQSGGANSTADTATEARIDHANVSRLVRDMQLQVIKFAQVIFQNLAWYEWSHPVREQNVEILVGEEGYAVEDTLTPEDRDGDFAQFLIEIIPDSFEHRSSRQQLDELMKGVMGLIIPAMQMPSERPVTLKIPELIQAYSEMANVPEMEHIAEYATDESFVSSPTAAPPVIPQQPQQAAPAGPGAGGNQGGGIADKALAAALGSGNTNSQDES